MACEENILDLVPLSPSLPDADDMVMFTLPDGTSILRAWSTISTGLIPDDVNVEVVASGGDINNGDTTKTYAQFIGRRVRFYRNGLKQSTFGTRSSFYSFNIGTGQFSFSPAAQIGELMQFEAY